MIKTQIKNFETALKTEDLDKVQRQYTLAIKRIDKVASTSTLHKNTAGRMKSRLTKQLNGLKAKKT
jgi:small subunit ribosomal protein S20